MSDEQPNKKYRYFNQPIEQIPGFEINKKQALVHDPQCGLKWMDIVECAPEEESSE